MDKMNKIPYKTNQKNPQVQAYKDAVDRGMKNQHVIPKGNGWAVKRAGAQKASGVYNTQDEATKQATSLARNQGTAVFVHKQNGQIKSSRTYYTNRLPNIFQP
jgi:uncharacterized protein YdaT